MNDELPQARDERTERVRQLVWHARSKVERTHLRMAEVTSFLGQLEERRAALRTRSTPPGSRPILEAALAALDSSHEEIRVVGEEMQRRGEQLVEWEADAAAKLRFHRRLIDRAPMAFFLTDENGMIAEANEEAARVLHVTSAYLRSKPIVNFVSRRDVGTARSFVRAVAHSDQVLENVIVFRPRRGGPAFTAEVRACSLERREVRAIGWLVREMRQAPSEATAATDGPANAAERPDVLGALKAALSLLREAREALRAGASDGAGDGAGDTSRTLSLVDRCDAVIAASDALGPLANQARGDGQA